MRHPTTKALLNSAGEVFTFTLGATTTIAVPAGMFDGYALLGASIEFTDGAGNRFGFDFLDLPRLTTVIASNPLTHIIAYNTRNYPNQLNVSLQPAFTLSATYTIPAGAVYMNVAFWKEYSRINYKHK